MDFSLLLSFLNFLFLQLKGADRKHKQDREKIMKKSPSERENYQNSYECTVFTDVRFLTYLLKFLFIILTWIYTSKI